MRLSEVIKYLVVGVVDVEFLVELLLVEVVLVFFVEIKLKENSKLIILVDVIIILKWMQFGGDDVFELGDCVMIVVLIGG